MIKNKSDFASYEAYMIYRDSCWGAQNRVIRSLSARISKCTRGLPVPSSFYRKRYFMGVTRREFLEDFERKLAECGEDWPGFGKRWEVGHLFPVAHCDFTDLAQAPLCFHPDNLAPVDPIEFSSGGVWCKLLKRSVSLR
jgi:hypothetical protein